jgi:hypothetical protein
MASSHTRVQARSRNGAVDVHSTTTDAPILPIEQLDRLREISPDRVSWVFEQTELESNFRRAENRRINTMVFIERGANLLFALVVAALCIGASVYLAMHDKELPATVIGGTTVVGLVVAFVTGRSGNPKK